VDVKPYSILLTVVFLAIGGVTLALGWPVIVAWFAFGITVIVAAFVPVAVLHYSSADRLRAMTKFGHMFASGDIETRDAVGSQYPRLRLTLNGSARLTVADSGVSLAYFREFMAGSNPVTVYSKRWTGRTTDRIQYEMWLNWLMQEGAVVPDSARGPESYRWRTPDHFHHYYQYVTMRPPAELFPAEPQTPEGVYPRPESEYREQIAEQFET
jgi:hypothetical protein